MKFISPITEKKIERHLVERAARKGSLAVKFTSPQRRSVPDRLVLSPVAPEHREIVGRYVKFIEVKKPGGVMTEGQNREAARLTGLGFTVYCLKSNEEIDAVI